MFSTSYNYPSVSSLKIIWCPINDTVIYQLSGALLINCWKEIIAVPLHQAVYYNSGINIRTSISAYNALEWFIIFVKQFPVIPGWKCISFIKQKGLWRYVSFIIEILRFGNKMPPKEFFNRISNPVLTFHKWFWFIPWPRKQ